MEQQQQNTSKKRKKQQVQQKSKPQSMRNILITPYKRSWPILPLQYQKEFEDLFYTNLSLLVPQKQRKIAWSELKDIPRENRKSIREKYRKPIEIDLNIRKSLVFGVNECTKALEKRFLIAVLISKDCDPEMMVNHVVRIADRQKIVVFVIPSLKDTMQKVVGFKCLCIGFKNYENLGKFEKTVHFLYKAKNISIRNALGNIHYFNEKDDKMDIIELVDALPEISTVEPNKKNTKNDTNLVEISINQESDLPNIQDLDVYSVADSSSMDLNNSDLIIESIPDNSVTALSENISNNIIILEPQVASNPAIFEQNINLSRNSDITVNSDELNGSGPYLYRTSTSKRIFEPPKNESLKKIAKILKNPNDFISLGDNSNLYTPSIIKRMKGNKNKIKKKSMRK